MELTDFQKDKPPGRVSRRIRSLFLLRSCKTRNCMSRGEEREGSDLESSRTHFNEEAQL